MNEAGLIPFFAVFPRQAAVETRTITTRGQSTLPDDDYGLLESYCAEAGCHCRRVMLNVTSRKRQVPMATISYGFDRDDELAGPFLDLLNPQSKYAKALLGLVERVLADPAYVARLEAHYYQVKGAVADPAHPVQRLLASLAAADADQPLSPPVGKRKPRRRRVGGTGEPVSPRR